MKKFTIFLLTFLLFVGFINVFATSSKTGFGVKIPLQSGDCWTESGDITAVELLTVTVSGPTVIQKLPTVSPVFKAHVGTSDPADFTYEWYLNGILDPSETSETYTLTDPNVLGNVGDYEIAVKAIEIASPFDEGMSNAYHFKVECYTATVTIVGPTEACIGDRVTLTAIVQTEATEYTLQWKEDGNYFVPSETGQTYSFIVTGDIDMTEFQVEVSPCGCVSVSSPVHYFQLLPKTIVMIPDYTMCEGGAVTVEANIVNFTQGNVYRYIWYDDTPDPIDTTYINSRVFDAEGTYYVSAEMLNSACSSDLVAFEITTQGVLEEVEIILPTSLYTCTETPVYFKLGDDPNVENFGAPTISWWVDGIELPGEGLTYINIPFYTAGTHYVYARLVYPGNNCEYITDAVSITVRKINGVTVAGPNTVCDDITPTYLLAVVDPVDALVTYQWYGTHEGVPYILGTMDTQKLESTPSPYPYIYMVKVTDEQAGCVAQSELHYVTVEQFVNVGITADKTQICSGETVMLTANVSHDNNMIYRWLENSQDSIGNAPVLYVNPIKTTTYTFSAQQIGSDCMAISNEVTVNVIVVPEITIVAIDSTICKGSQLTFELTNKDTVVYEWFINSIKIQGAELKTLTYLFDQVGVFHIQVSVAGCASGLTNVGTITVKETPSVYIAGPTFVCDAANNATKLVAIVTPTGAVVTYQWYVTHNGVQTKLGTDTTETVASTPSPNPYIYIVEITDTESNCVIQSLAHVVYVEQLARIGVSADKTNVCAGETVMLVANVSNDPNMNYQWFIGGDSIKGATAPILYVNPDTTSVYKFTAEQIGSGCLITSNEVKINVAPMAQYGLDTVLMVPENGEICDGGQVTLTAVPDNENEDYYYIWYVNGQQIWGENLATVLVSPLTVDQDETKYVYNVVAIPVGIACTIAPNADLAKTVTVRRNPVIELFGQHHVCDIYSNSSGSNIQFPNVHISARLDGSNEYLPAVGSPEYFTWYWNTTPIITLDDPDLSLEPQNYNKYHATQSEPHLFKLEYSSPYGCYAVSDIFEVYVHPQPVVNITSTEDSICQGGSVTLHANLNDYNETNYVYQWFQIDHINAVPYLIPGATQPYFTTPAMEKSYLELFSSNTDDIVIATYWVQVKQVTTHVTTNDTLTCFVHEKYELKVFPKPVIDSITIDKTNICSGGQVTLTAYPKENNLGVNPVYIWEINGVEQPDIHGPSFTHSPIAIDGDVTVYTYNVKVRYENSGCESKIDNDLAVSVTVYGNPVVVISGDANICETEYVFLKASVDGESLPVGNASFTWYESGEERTILPSEQFYSEYWPPRFEPYVFTVKVTRGDGCTTLSEPFYVWVHEVPVVNIAASEETVCEGGCVTLTANLNNYNTENIIIQWNKWIFDEYTLNIGGQPVTFVDSFQVVIPGATGQTYQVCGLTEDTKYEVTVTQTHSLCSASSIQWIKVTPVPVVVPDALVIDTICNGEQVTLHVFTTIADVIVTDVTYKWFENGVIIEGATQDTYIHTSNTAGTYIYTVQAIVPISGCISTIDTIGMIVVKDAPSVYIQGTPIVCDTENSTYLTAIVDPSNAPVKYQWYMTHNGTDTLLGTDPVQEIVAIASPYQYIYIVTITDTVSNCTVQSLAYTVLVEQFPVIGITADKTKVCVGETVTLIANVPEDNNMIYQWFAGQDSIVGATGPIYYANPDTTTVYSFTAMQIGSDCKATSNIVKVTVIDTLKLLVVPVLDTICEGNQVTFTVTPLENVTYTWYVNGTVVAGAELDTFTYIFTQHGTFEVKVSATSNVGGCTSAIVWAGTIVVKDAPSVYIQGTPIVCDTDNSTYLTAIVDPSNAPVKYQWYMTHNGKDTLLGTDQVQEIVATASPYQYVYIVTITDTVSNCTVQSLAYTVLVEQFPVIGITADKTEVCAGETVTLTANVPEDNNMIYQWYLGGDAIDSATGPVYYANPDTTTVYTFTAKQIGSECEATSNIVKVTVIAAPTLTITPVMDTICQGEQKTFVATATATEAITYTWYINGIVVPGADLATFTHIFDHFGIFEVKVSATSNIAGCTSEIKEAGTITVKAAPSVEIAGPTAICNAADPTFLYAIVTPTGATVTYQWYEYHNGITVTKGTFATQIVNTVGSPYPYIYTVEITDIESGCVIKSIPHIVYIGQFNNIGITADKTEICAGETVMLSAYISESTNMVYQWKANSVAIQGANAPIYYANPTQTTTYTFEAKQKDSDCIIYSNSVTVTVIEVPVITIEPVFDTICQGEQVAFVTTITPAIPVTYTWYVGDQVITGADLSSLTYIFDHYGIFNVKVSATTQDAGCTTAIVDAGTITVKAAPTVSISGPTAVCNTTTPVFLYADVAPITATVTYQWYLNGGLLIGATGATQAIINTPSDIPWNYKVQITDTESGCVVVSEVHQVTVTSYSNISIGADETEVCLGTSVTITADMEEYINWLYQWYHNGEEIEGETHLVLVTDPTTGSHNYSFIATQIGTGCEANSNTVNIIVKPIPEQPVLTISDDKICSGDPVTISGDVSGSYDWYKNGMVFATGADQIITDQPTANNILTNYVYKATVTVNGCTSELSEPVTVTVHPAINVTIAGAHEVCEQALEGEQLALHALHTTLSGVSYEYKWYYYQGNNPAVEFYANTNNPYALVPNNLPYNDPAAPYCFTVEVTVVDYGCTAASACHQVNILQKPTVTIAVDYENICLGGTIMATAYPTPTPTPENPYNYVWTVNGNVLPQNASMVAVSEYLTVGINNITVTIERAYASHSCFASITKNVNVLTPPSLALTQNIEGLNLPGMCVGGTVNLFAEIINFDENLVNPSQFTYEWRLNGNPILPPPTYNFTSQTLNVTGTYNYDVKAYIPNSTLGCNAAWTAFDPVKVVQQPTLSIFPKDYNLYEVCVGAVLEIGNNLGMPDPAIQMGYQYKWNDLSDWINFTNQIDPRTVEFNTPGQRTFFLEATFANPTCKAVTSDPLTIKIIADPVWSVISIQPDEYSRICLGELVTVEAAFSGGVSDGSNWGRIQWMYQFNSENYVNITGPGGIKTHKPAQEGDYYYMATYIPAHELSGCNIDSAKLGPIVVTPTPAAWFVANLPGGVTPHICANAPISEPLVLTIKFAGTPPYNCVVTGSTGNYKTIINTDKEIYDLIVTPRPTETTTYTIESLDDDTHCTTSTFIKSNITIVVTNVVILNPTLEACSSTADLQVKMNSFIKPEAIVTFPCAAPMYLPIVLSGDFHIISIPIPACAGLGMHNITVTIDGCDYAVTIVNNYSDQGARELIYRRWEGNAEVLTVSNNYMDPANPYYNGGYQFTSYQWYKNGVLIPGATKQYYQDPEGVNGVYSVRLTGIRVSDGTPFEFRTCDKAFNPSLTLKVYPIPAQVDEPVYVEIDLTPEEMAGATLDIYDAKGAHVKHIQVVNAVTEVTGFKAQGAYYGKLTTGTNEIKSVRFLIVK